MTDDSLELPDDIVNDYHDNFTLVGNPDMARWEDAPCVCVKSHTPQPRETHRHHVWPLGDDGPNTPDNIVPLCPTSHANVHVLYRALKKNNGVLPGHLARGVNAYVRDLALEGYHQAFPTTP